MCGTMKNAKWAPASGVQLLGSECRDGRWAIVHRVCVHEWTRSEPLGAAMPIEAQLFRQGSQDRAR